MSPRKSAPAAGGDKVSRVRGGRTQNASVAKAAGKAIARKRTRATPKAKASTDGLVTDVNPARLMGRIRGLDGSDLQVSQREPDDDVLKVQPLPGKIGSTGKRGATSKKAPASKKGLAGTVGVGTTPALEAVFDPNGEFRKVKAQWVGVDAKYGKNTTAGAAAEPAHPSIELTDQAGGTSVRLRATGNSNPFAHFGQYDGKAGLWIGADDTLPGRVVVRAGDGTGRVVLDAAECAITVRGPSGHARAHIAPTNNATQLVLYDDQGYSFAYMGDWDGYGALALGGNGRYPGRIVLRSGTYENQIVLDAESGDIVLTNADCAEEFDVADGPAEPGTVLVLDDEPGRLRPSDSPYDTRVAGVVSGAGAFKPGIVLDRRSGRTDRSPVALVGKVFCRVEADSAPITPGTLLTTSIRPGMAMAATERDRAFGAVLGKSLAPLASGSDLLPILVTLQ